MQVHLYLEGQRGKFDLGETNVKGVVSLPFLLKYTPAAPWVISSWCANVIIHKTTDLQFSVSRQHPCGYPALHLAVVLPYSIIFKLFAAFEIT